MKSKPSKTSKADEPQYKNCTIYSGVKLGPQCRIEEYCSIGKPAAEDKNRRRRTVIGGNALIRSGSTIYAGMRAGNNFTTGDGARIAPGCVFGKHVVIGSNSVIGNCCRLADGVVIHSLVELAEYTTIDSGAWIGPGVVTANTIHPKSSRCPSPDQCRKRGAPHIGKNVRIGAHATISAFVTIGHGAIIGAGAVVIRDVPAGAVVAGNPAIIIKTAHKIECKFDRSVNPY